MPSCERCGGILKPDVVFFGESVPMVRVDQSFAAIEAVDALPVAGSSLTVYSGHRFVVAPSERRKEVAILNIGATRGDALATLKLQATCGAVLSGVVGLLSVRA